MAPRQPKNSKRPVRIEHSAGGIVFKNGARGIEIGFIQDPYYKWTFPKGHIKPGEEIVAAAMRETSEEMGLIDLTPVSALPTLDIWFVDRFVHKGSLIHKYITLVLMEASADAVAKPQRSEKIRGVRWVPFTRALSFSSYANTRLALMSAMQMLSARFNLPMPKRLHRRKKHGSGKKTMAAKVS